MKMNEIGSLLTALVEQMEISNSTKRVMSVKDVALYLDVSDSLIYKLTSQRKIPHSKLLGKGKIYFDRQKVIAWALENEIPVYTSREQNQLFIASFSVGSILTPFKKF